MPNLMAFGWSLTVCGGLIMVLLSTVFDPMSATSSIRTLMTLAFGAAQLGLTLVTIKGFQRLFGHASRIANRRRDK